MELPRDVLSQILSRLPVKSLMCCKGVCKSWFSLIRDPLFARTHQTVHKKNQHKTTNLFLASWNIRTKESNNLMSIQIKHDESGNITATPPIHLGSPPHARWHSFYSSSFSLSAGIVCHYSFFDNEPVHIFNPCTREDLILPMQRPLKQVTLGFSSVTNEYKVLHGRRIYECKVLHGRIAQSPVYKLKILSLSGGTWSNLPDIDFEELGVDQRFVDFSKCSSCIHGALHWILPATNGGPILLAFDVGQEIFRVIPLPQYYNKMKYWNLLVIQVNGCLAVFDLDEQKGTYDITTMDFWILKDYQNQVWFKDSIIFPVPRWKLGYPLPAGSIHTGELLLAPSGDLNGKYGFVHLYDMSLQTYNKTEIVLPIGSVILAAGYDETIFPLK